MSSRFVILHHTHADGEHWDLMLERDGVLLTWQLPAEPAGAKSLPIRARRIADHRLAYLTYEGPISGDRGHVRRIDAGTVEFHEITPDRLTMTLYGSRLVGRCVLGRGDDEWVLSIEANRDGWTQLERTTC